MMAATLAERGSVDVGSGLRQWQHSRRVKWVVMRRDEWEKDENVARKIKN